MQTPDQILSTLDVHTKQLILTAIDTGAIDLNDQIEDQDCEEVEKELEKDVTTLLEVKALLISLLYKKPGIDNLARYWVNQPSTLQPHHNLHGVNLIAETTPDSDGIVRAYMVEGDTISMNIQKGSLCGGWKPVNSGTVKLHCDIRFGGSTSQYLTYHSKHLSKGDFIDSIKKQLQFKAKTKPALMAKRSASLMGLIYDQFEGNQYMLDCLCIAIQELND